MNTVFINMNTGSKLHNLETNKSTNKIVLDEKNQTVTMPFPLKTKNSISIHGNAKDKLRNRLFETGYFSKAPPFSIKEKKDNGIVPLRVLQGKEFYINRSNDLNTSQNIICSVAPNQPLNLNKIPNIIDASFSRKPKVMDKLPPLRDRRSESPFVKQVLVTATHNRGERFVQDSFIGNYETIIPGLNDVSIADRRKDTASKTKRFRVTVTNELKEKEKELKNIVNSTVNPVQQSFNDSFSHNVIEKLTGRNLPPPRIYKNSGRVIRSTSVKHRKLINIEDSMIESIDLNEVNENLSVTKSVRDIKFIPDEDLEGNKTANNEETVLKLRDIDSFIYLMKEGRLNPAEFIYLVKSSSSDLYNLKTVEFSEINDKQYFTLSEKGVCKFENNMPVEFVTLKEWLRERDQYNAIKQLSFFKKFRRWKTLKKWITILRKNKKAAVSARLMEKLFYANPILQSLLLKHKELCTKIENMRFVDAQLNLDIQTLDIFSSTQERKRSTVIEDLQKLSKDLHENSRSGIRQILEKLRDHIVSEMSNQDEEKQKTKEDDKQDFKEITDSMNKGNGKNVFESFGFPEFLNYGHRSLLRNECSRFLRLAYLLDFITIEALGNMYILSAKDLLGRLTDIYNMYDNDISLGFLQKKQLHEPLFIVSVEFEPIEIREESIRYEEIEVNLQNIQEFDLNSYAQFEKVFMITLKIKFMNKLIGNRRKSRRR